VPEPTLSRFFETWQLDPVALAAVLLLAALYLAGVVRHRRRTGRLWSPGRTAAFLLLGLGTIVLATMSALAVWNRVVFWPAATQNILLDLVAPLGLAIGDPLGLARVTVPRWLRLLTYPLVSSVAVLVSELTIYFTPYFATSLHDDGVRQLMHLQLLLTGCLFVLPMLTGQELLPRWCTHPVRALLVFVDGLLDSVPGIVVMTSGTLVAGHWYTAHRPSWEGSVRHEQFVAGGLMLTLAELVGLPFLFAVFVEWWRHERERTAELDARLDRELVPVTATAPGATAGPAPVGTAPAGTAPAAVPTPAADPDRVRPWWETDAGDVGRRFRGER
jgi:putative copper resistance protein D